MKKILRKIFVDGLPATWQLAFFRNYFYWGKRDYVRHEVDLFRALSDANRNSLDIGANEGLYAMYLCRFAKSITCFEPLPWMVEQLRGKFSGTGNVRIEHCALGSKVENAVIKIPVTKNKQYDTRSSLVGGFSEQLIDGANVVSVKEVNVSVKRLDDFGLRDIGFIKIDVEGFELEVLKGGAETIAREKPNLYIEIEQKHHPADSITHVFGFVEKLGFAGFFEFQDQVLPVAKFDVKKHQSVAAQGKDYAGNFIFVPLNSALAAKFARGGSLADCLR